MTSVQQRRRLVNTHDAGLSECHSSDSESGSVANMAYGRLHGVSKNVARVIYSLKNLRDAKEEPSVMLDSLWNCGYNAFECSANQGTEQKLLGQWMQDSNIGRDDIVLIVTGDRVEDLLASCERLMVQSVDLFILTAAPVLTVKDTIAALSAQVQAGQTTAYGLSKWNTAQLEQAMLLAQTDESLVAPVSDLVHHSLAVSTQQMFASTTILCDEKREKLYPKQPELSVLATGALAAGFLCGNLTPASGGSVQWSEAHSNGAYFKAENYARRARVAALAQSRGTDPCQIATAFVLSQLGSNSFCVVSSSSLEHARQNANATKVKLSLAEQRFLEAGTTPDVQTAPLVTPAQIMEEQPLSAQAALTVFQGREAIANVLSGKDDRLIAITGPCSIHDPKAAIDYARELKQYAEAHKDTLLVVMRVYFEKPRTTVGWKGLTSDPDLNGECNMNKGLRLCRQILMQINEMGLPCAVELLSNMTPPYLSDLVSWAAIGARTTESQVHREMVSSLSEIPVGFKNGTMGNVDIALDAIQSSNGAHTFLGVGPDGRATLVSSKGNPHGHIVLRGGKDGPNFSAQHVSAVAAQMEKKNIRKRLVIDCSHGNSNKDHKNQPKVAADIGKQMAEGSQLIGGVMIESNLVEGAQKLDPGKTDLSTLKKGVSVTDACVDLPTTSEMFVELSQGVKRRRLQ